MVEEGRLLRGKGRLHEDNWGIEEEGGELCGCGPLEFERIGGAVQLLVLLDVWRGGSEGGLYCITYINYTCINTHLHGEPPVEGAEQRGVVGRLGQDGGFVEVEEVDEASLCVFCPCRGGGPYMYRRVFFKLLSAPLHTPQRITTGQSTTRTVVQAWAVGAAPERSAWARPRMAPFCRMVLVGSPVWKGAWNGGECCGVLYGCGGGGGGERSGDNVRTQISIHSFIHTNIRPQHNATRFFPSAHLPSYPPTYPTYLSYLPTYLSTLPTKHTLTIVTGARQHGAAHDNVPPLEVAAALGEKARVGPLVLI